jgi:DeoR/GlpR family transcriptional regulator of sugar metabolism
MNCAVSLDKGLTNDYLPEVSTDRVIIHSAPEVILVADHSKFGQVSTALVAPIAIIKTLVTDSALDDAILSRLRELIGNVLIA